MGCTNGERETGTGTGERVGDSHGIYHEQVVRRATALLEADAGICRRYVHHLELEDAVDLEGLRGAGVPRRWYLV